MGEGRLEKLILRGSAFSVGSFTNVFIRRNNDRNAEERGNFRLGRGQGLDLSIFQMK